MHSACPLNIFKITFDRNSEEVFFTFYYTLFFNRNIWSLHYSIPYLREHKEILVKEVYYDKSYHKRGAKYCYA